MLQSELETREGADLEGKMMSCFLNQLIHGAFRLFRWRSLGAAVNVVPHFKQNRPKEKMWESSTY